jgi:hypothetical protein
MDDDDMDYSCEDLCENYWETSIEDMTDDDTRPYCQRGSDHEPHRWFKATHCTMCHQPIVLDATTRKYKVAEVSWETSAEDDVMDDDGAEYDCEIHGHEPHRDLGNDQTKCIICFKHLVRDSATGRFTLAPVPCEHTNTASEYGIIVCRDCGIGWNSGADDDVMDDDDAEYDCEIHGHEPHRDLGNVRTMCIMCFKHLVRDPATGSFTLAPGPCEHTNTTSVHGNTVCYDCDVSW